MKWFILMILAAPLAVFAFSASSAAHASGARRVTVTLVNYHGWSNALKISNGIVEALVVPQAGRIMAFEYAGRPDTNPFWNNLSWSDKTMAHLKPSEAPAVGGDKIWLSQQGDWPHYVGSTWPPDPRIEWYAQRAEVIPNGVKMLGNPSSLYGVVMDRSITMKPGAPELFLSETMRRISEPHPAANAVAPPATSAIPVGIWNVTEVTGNSVAVLPIASHSRFPHGIIVMSPAPASGQAPNTLPDGWTSNGKFLIGRRNGTTSNKVGTDSPEGWIAAWTGGSTVLTERIAGYTSGKYPDGGCDIESYCSGAAPPFIEIELLGAMKPLAIGEQQNLGVTWRLSKLKSKPASNIALAKFAAKSAMAQP